MKKQVLGYSVKETDTMLNMLRAENERLNSVITSMQKTIEKQAYELETAREKMIPSAEKKKEGKEKKHGEDVETTVITETNPKEEETLSEEPADEVLDADVFEPVQGSPEEAGAETFVLTEETDGNPAEQENPPEEETKAKKKTKKKDKKGAKEKKKEKKSDDGKKKKKDIKKSDDRGEGKNKKDKKDRKGKKNGKK